MNSQVSSTLAAPSATPAVGATDFFANPGKVLLAAGDPARWTALRELVRGTPLSLRELAVAARRTSNQMGKHLAVLREAGLVVAVPSPDGDGRKQCFVVPEAFRRTDAEGRLMLDFGVCLLRFGDVTEAEPVSPFAKD